ncbi:MAG: flagellar motor protein MotB [Nevskia sp.]|nr:flagellar motor protein MotB [Nevskia sp.]
MASDGKAAEIVIRRIRKTRGGGHHGGAWKVAYADFVTAMMAFFLVMWLVGATTNKQKAAISEYFKNPSAVEGKSVSPAPGPNGPGGASSSMIQFGGTMEVPHGPGPDQLNKKSEQPAVPNPTNPQATPVTPSLAQAKQLARAEERRRLQDLFDRLHAAIEQSQALQPFKDQLLLDITPEGLRVQIVDKQNRPMFDLGGTALKPYTSSILRELAGFINAVPNRVSITGHTDTTPYANDMGYTNWELSAERANAARRALLAGGMGADKVARVVGMASSALFDRENPRNPMNRRISIVVMSHDTEESVLAQDLAKAVPEGEVTAEAAPAAVPAPAAVVVPAPAPAAAPASAPEPDATGK